MQSLAQSRQSVSALLQATFRGVYVWQYLWILPHLALYFYWLDHTVFYGDDGTWLFRAQWYAREGWKALSHLFPWEEGRPSSRHPYVAALLHSFFYRIHPSLFSILTGVALLHALTWLCVFRLGNQLKRPALGLLFSFFYFWTPAMSVYFGMRLWQVVYLPMAVSHFAICLVRYASQRDLKLLFWMSVWVSISIWFHASSLALFSIPIVLYWNRSDEISHHRYWQTALCCYLLLLPWWVPLVKNREPWPVLVFLSLFVIWALRFIGPLKRLRLLAVPAGGLLFCFLMLGSMTGSTVVNFMDVLAAPSSWVAKKILLPSAEWHRNVYSPTVWLWGASLLYFCYRALRSQDRLASFLVLGGTVPLLVLMSAQFISRTGPHQYAVFLLPVAWMAMAWAVAEWRSSSKVLFWGVTLVILLFHSVSTAFYHEHTTTSGGVGTRCSSLGQKLTALRYVCDRGVSELVLMHPEPNRWSCLKPESWLPLLRELKCETTAASPAPRAYLSERHFTGEEYVWEKGWQSTWEQWSSGPLRLRFSEEKVNGGTEIRLGSKRVKTDATF